MKLEKWSTEALERRRLTLIERMGILNNPGMFDTKSYERQKHRTRIQLHRIAEVLYVRLGLDKRFVAL